MSSDSLQATDPAGGPGWPAGEVVTGSAGEKAQHTIYASGIAATA